MGYKRSVYKTFSLISQLGISMMVPVIICTIAGVKLDERFGISSTIPLIIIGVLAGVRNVYALVRHANEDPEDGKDEEE